MSDDVTALRRRLRAKGFAPIPVSGKIPALEGWQLKHDTNDAEIGLWAKLYPYSQNTGILTRLVPTLDIDILNPEAAAAVEALARERLDERGYLPVRFGRSPKRALPFRTGEPFKKIGVALIAPDGDTSQKLELLCDGQQVVVDGIHPDTKKPYDWHGPKPGEISREELAYIIEAEARALVEDAADLLIREHGYQRARGIHTNGPGARGAGPVDWGAAFSNIVNGIELHDSIRDLAASMIATGVSAQHTERTLHALLNASSTPHDERWQERVDDLGRAVGTAGKFGKPQTNGQAPPQLVPIDLARYDTEPIPGREWGVRDRFPRRSVALLSGEGAIGKSVLFLQLSVAHVLARDWLRSLPEPGPVLLVNCEDESDELVRRLAPILDSYHAKFSDVAAGLHTFSLANCDPLLAAPDRNGRILPTPLYAELLAMARAVRPICIVIDNVADVFGGSELDRSQVRQFVALMRQLAIAANGYVIMSAHPSLTGIASKSGLSGSTQWHNSVRARAYMHKLSENGGENPTGPRVLEFMKSNYSALSERLELQWTNGLYLPARTPTAPEQAAANAAADALFLQLLDRSTGKGENLSARQTANNFAPTVFAKVAESKAQHFGREHFMDALDRLIEVGRVAVEPYGAPSRALSRLIRGALP